MGNLKNINRKILKFILITSIVIFQSRFVSGQLSAKILDVQLPKSINFIKINGKEVAYYELYLTNTSKDSVRLNRVSAINLDDSVICFQTDMASLENRFSNFTNTKGKSVLLLGGESGVFYIELFLEKEVSEISHNISIYVSGNKQPREFTIKTENIKCEYKNDLVLGNPLKGIWTAVYEPSWDMGHRKVIYTVNGKSRIPGRYAIDFIKMDKKGQYAKKDEDKIENWFGYKANVLAVADGIVSSIKTDFEESKKISTHPDQTAENATGNYISIKIGDNQFAFYEHLKPNSIKVKIGQSIKKGDIIASLGFTGQTTGPHLHFHVADADSPLGAEGVPYVFEKFEIIGSYPVFEKFGKQLWMPINKTERSGERPLPNSVIKF